MSDIEDMLKLGQRIERQRVATGDEDETVLLKPAEVDRVVLALYFAANIKMAFTILAVPL